MDRRERDRQIQESTRLEDAASKRQLLFASAARSIAKLADQSADEDAADVEGGLDDIARSLENLLDHMEAIYFQEAREAGAAWAQLWNGQATINEIRDFQIKVTKRLSDLKARVDAIREVLDNDPKLLPGPTASQWQNLRERYLEHAALEAGSQQARRSGEGKSPSVFGADDVSRTRRGLALLLRVLLFGPIWLAAIWVLLNGMGLLGS